MNILYDATPLLLRSAGVKNYHYALLARLIPRIAPHRLMLFPFLRSPGVNFNEGSNFPKLATILRLGAVLADNYLRAPVASLAARKADLFHVTPHLLQPPRRVRLTAFVHDPTCLFLPEFHTASNVRYFRHFVRKVLPHLAGILTPSEAVKRDLMEHVALPGDRIVVVAHGVDEVFFQPAPERPPLDLPGRYILFLGTMEPRKNLAALLEAYRLLPPDLRRDYPLVIGGASGWKNRQIQGLIESTPGIRKLGYVPPEALPLVYAGASVFVFPSLYEGFGMPLLEAMASGAPVVTSNLSAMPEVAGDAALTVDPRSASEIARAIERVLCDPGLARALRGRGRARARQFTWEKAALATKSFWEGLA